MNRLVIRRSGSPCPPYIDVSFSVEMIMKLRLLIVLACTLLAISACVIVPVGGGGGRGEYYRGDQDRHEYGHRVWHP